MMHKKINRIDHAVVMAAGRGMRMRPLTDNIPKAMAPIGQSTLIANGIESLKKNILNVHITVGYKGAILSKHVIEKDVSSVINTEGKGNCWWVYNSLIKNLNEPTWVLTCDNIVDINFQTYIDEYYDKLCPAAMLIPVNPIEGIDGDYIIKNENNEIIEISRSITSDIYCSGIQIIHPEKINKITQEVDNFNDLWKQLILRKEVICADTKLKRWISIDDLTQLNLANKNIDESLQE
jgi:NDP-sugar pyrophosphorylase family protein